MSPIDAESQSSTFRSGAASDRVDTVAARAAPSAGEDDRATAAATAANRLAFFIWCVLGTEPERPVRFFILAADFAAHKLLRKEFPSSTSARSSIKRAPAAADEAFGETSPDTLEDRASAVEAKPITLLRRS